MNHIIDILNEILILIGEMSPYLLLGFLLAGLMHEFIPSTLYTKYLSAQSLRAVLLSALFGVPLPLCSCGVIPTAMGIRREGASRGATISFLIATPQTGVDSIIATYSLMGLPFAIVRPIAALLTAILGGTLCNAFDHENTDNLHEHTTANTTNIDTNRNVSFLHRIGRALSYAFVEMMEDIGRWLLVGLLVAGIITAVVPDGWFAAFQGNTLYSILFVLLFSIPMYLCATGSIPIAVALMLKGLTPGAALVLLMAGPASNMASILVIRKVLGHRSLFIYLASIAIGAIAFAFAVDALPREWFTNHLIMHHSTCCNEELGLFNWMCTILLALMLLNVFCFHKLIGCHHQCHSNHQDQKSASTALFHINGMHCHHCAINVEKAILSVQGVKRVAVSLEEGRAEVEGDFEEAAIIQSVESLGFTCQSSLRRHP